MFIYLNATALESEYSIFYFLVSVFFRNNKYLASIYLAKLHVYFKFCRKHSKSYIEMATIMGIMVGEFVCYSITAEGVR